MSEFQLIIDTPEGTSLQGMEKAVLELTPQLLAIDGVRGVNLSGSATGRT